MSLRKTQLAAAVGAALLVGGTAVQAQNLQVQLFGQVGKAVMFADDGVQSKTFFVDAETAGTRPLGIRASMDVMPGLRAGLFFQAEMQSNSSDKVSIDAASHMETSHLRERFAEVILEGGWGRINLGQGEAGADNASTRDLSGTHNGTCACDWGGAIKWRDSTGAKSDFTPGSTHNNFDFEGRYDRFMYSTPKFGGFWGQVSTGQIDGTTEANEASLWYSGKLAGDVVAAIGWSKANTGTGLVDDRETMGGSISWLHTSGLNLTFGYTQREGIADPTDLTDDPGREGTWMWGKVGYKFGPHAVAFDYGQSEDQVFNGVEGKIYGIGYTWSPVRWFEIFALYQLFTLDLPAGAGSAEDISVAAIGTVVKW